MPWVCKRVWLPGLQSTWEGQRIPQADSESEQLCLIKYPSTKYPNTKRNSKPRRRVRPIFLVEIWRERRESREEERRLNWMEEEVRGAEGGNCPLSSVWAGGSMKEIKLILIPSFKGYFFQFSQSVFRFFLLSLNYSQKDGSYSN